MHGPCQHEKCITRTFYRGEIVTTISGAFLRTGGNAMKAAIIATLMLLGAVEVALASCPPGTRYDCYTTANGRQSCGCR